MSRVAFVGLGHMGAPMAKNLLRAGFPLQVFDLNLDAVNELTAAGARGAADVRQAVQGAEVVVSMLPLAISTRMPRPSATFWPSSLVALMPVSSKRTPLTITEPKPVTVPWVKAVAVAVPVLLPVVVVLSPPPPPQAAISSRLDMSAATQPRTGVNKR